MPHSPQERRGVRKVENSRVTFRRSFRFGASQLCGSTRLVGLCGVQVDMQQPVTSRGCDPGSSLGHAHPHGGATTSSASFNGCRGKPFPRARPRLLLAVHVLAVCMLCADLCVTLSVCVCTTPVCVCLAVQGAAGAAEKSKIQEWPLYEVSRSRLFADP